MKIKNIVEKLFKVIIFYFKKVWSTFKLTKYYKENKKKIVIVLFFLVYFWISPWKFPFIIHIVLWVWFITLFGLLLFNVYKVRENHSRDIQITMLIWQTILIIMVALSNIMSFFENDYVLSFILMGVLICISMIFVYMKNVFIIVKTEFSRVAFFILIIVLNLFYIGFSFGLIYMSNPTIFPTFIESIKGTELESNTLGLLYISLEGLRPFFQGVEADFIAENKGNFVSLLPYFEQILGYIYSGVIVAFAFKLLSVPSNP